MKKYTTILICFATALSSVDILAQDIPETPDPSGNKVYFTKTSQDTTVYKILEKDRSKNVNDLPVPHFAIHTANNKFVMTIGAKFNPIIGTDLGNDLYKNDDAGINFIPGQIYIPAQSGRKSDFFINALNADLDFQIVGFGGTKDQITGYLKFSTNGNSKPIKMSKAYLSWRGLTAGLKHTLFQDEKVVPPTIDPQGPNGLIITTVNEISYVTPKFKGFRFGIGIDYPEYYTSRGLYLGNDYRTWESKDIVGETVVDPNYYSFQCPDIPMFFEYGKGGNRVKLAAIFRPMIYRDLLADTRRCVLGWGLSLSGNLKPIDPVTIYLQANYGQGIGAYIQDLAGMPISFVPKDDHPGHMKATPMMSWTAGLTYNISPKWQANIMASQVRVWDVGAYAESEAIEPGEINNYKYGWYGAANVFYNISSYFQVGLEYLYGYRKSWNAGSGHDNRLQFQLQFSL